MDHGSEAKTEGWCILRCAGGAQDEIINRTMLRFRPIAPKPVSSDAVSGNTLADNKNLLFASKRSKRKYVRVRKNNGYRRKNNNIDKNIKKNNKAEKETDDEDGLNKNVVTLQLLPEKPTTKDHQESLSWIGSKSSSAKFDDNDNKNNNNRQDLTADIWVSFKGNGLINGDGGSSGGVSSDQRVFSTVVESWVTVESVTVVTSCMDSKGLELKVDLDEDTCPGFTSDGLNRVVWVNKAYKKMVMNGVGGGQEEIDVMVWLVIKEELPVSEDYSTFTTKVRLQYRWREEKYSKIVPCDVFRIDGGGFAWRLDVQAALSLGRWS